MGVTQTSLMSRLGERWDRRADSYRDGREAFTAQSATLILKQPHEVWAFLDSPGAGVLLHQRHERTFHVPGTPETGTGHQSCTFIMGENGVLEVTVSEVIEYDPPRRVTSKIVNSQIPMVEAQTIAEVPGGCSFAVSLGTRIPAGSAPKVGRQLQAYLDAFVTKVKTLVETEPQPESAIPEVRDS